MRTPDSFTNQNKKVQLISTLEQTRCGSSHSKRSSFENLPEDLERTMSRKEPKLCTLNENEVANGMKKFATLRVLKRKSLCTNTRRFRLPHNLMITIVHSFLVSCSGSKINRMRRKSCTNEKSDRNFPFSLKFSATVWSEGRARIFEISWEYCTSIWSLCWTTDCPNWGN